MAKERDYRFYLTTPYETGIRNFSSVAKYYLYYAPEIDSAQSLGKFNEQQADQALNNMLDASGLSKKAHFLKRIQSKSWNKYGLDSNVIDFECSRLLCNKFNNETNLHALLRHIRNALAHGYLYVYRKKGTSDFILLIDFDSKKKTSNGEKIITAKILVSMKILEDWKAKLENQIALGE